MLAIIGQIVLLLVFVVLPVVALVWILAASYKKDKAKRLAEEAAKKAAEEAADFKCLHRNCDGKRKGIYRWCTGENVFWGLR